MAGGVAGIWAQPRSGPAVCLFDSGSVEDVLWERNIIDLALGKVELLPVVALAGYLVLPSAL